MNGVQGHRGPLAPVDAAILFAVAPFPWWITGGWALDLFLGRKTREHEDLDIAVLRRDQYAAIELLASWDICIASQGGTRPFRPSEVLQLGDTELWCRRRSDEPWVLQVILMDCNQDVWMAREAPDITRPLGTVGLRTPDGLPYLAPELVLLVKALRALPKDQLDFVKTVPQLNEAARAWLFTALNSRSPTHPWLSGLGVVGDT